MSSVLQICNLALGHIGVKSIMSVDEASENARKCKLFYEPLRDTVLRGHSWNFATAYEQLAVLDESIPGWGLLYSEPARCLSIRKIISESSLVSPVAVDHKLILSPDSKVKAVATNLENAWAEFTYQVTDPTLFDAQFVEALSYRLGAALAQPLAGNIQMGQGLLQMSVTIMDSAKLSNSREGSQQKPNYSSTLAARG